ncbi:hypothetical protein FISHEDRAFT_49806 [Fistulina hepatica ATCC 64428]|uniref:Chromatin target of PRMT1 protein C-terminal domain-containing protein n=1 Tax=Fistulina hepatica ATCC 64428 TaxID=1128425 RepID=A0A0D7A335_9AGAR|nr:hypothetical protein FISHEDRAFT_49806 [Fistulina hepatica ATCC 64428]
MDNGAPEEQPVELSYDENVAYEDQVSPLENASLARRIGTTKVYLLSEVVDREHPAAEADNDTAVDEDSGYRSNALLLRGTPISVLSTSSIFDYAINYECYPLALEWIDDQSCVLVFESKALAESAYEKLALNVADEPDPEDGFVAAQQVPIQALPPEERVNTILGTLPDEDTKHQLQGTIKMRWARIDDVKQRGAKNASQYYKKHKISGEKRKRDDDYDGHASRSQLDAELEAFKVRNRDDEAEEVGKNPLLQRLRPSLESRLSDGVRIRNADLSPPQARQQRSNLGRMRGWSDDPNELSDDSRDDRYEGNSVRGTRDRPRKTQEELDAELDAFLNEAQ